MRMPESAVDRERLDRRLHAVGTVSVGSSIAQSTDELVTGFLAEPSQHTVESQPAGEQRRRKRGAGATVALVSVLAAITVAVPATAVGAWMSARTGTHGDPASSTEEDSTEWLDLSGDDLPAIVADAYPDGLQLPKSVGRDEATAKVNEIFQRLGGHENAIAQEGLITTTYEFWVICAWQNEWLLADDVSDLDRRQFAGDWLGDTANFPSIVAHDGGGVVDRLLVVADGAANGDRELVEQGYREGECSAQLGSDDR